MNDAMPFARMIGVEFLEASPEQVRARLDYRPELCTSGGGLHGGALMAFADSVGAMCAFLNLPDGATGTTTVESKTNFLRAVRDGYVEATSVPLHKGKTVIVVDTELRDAQGKLVARVTQSQLVLTR
jgi:1,4-dihydroxy-2-naphthoyl-CoA hydrolase